MLEAIARDVQAVAAKDLRRDLQRLGVDVLDSIVLGMVLSRAGTVAGGGREAFQREGAMVGGARLGRVANGRIVVGRQRGEVLLPQVTHRLNFLCQVGVVYLERDAVAAFFEVGVGHVKIQV